MIKSLLAAALMVLGTGFAASAIEDATSHYTTSGATPQVADPDEKSDFSDGQTSTEYPGNQTRSQYYMGEGPSQGSTYSNRMGALSYGFSGGSTSYGSTTYGPYSHY
jgi:hypothetical protein